MGQPGISAIGDFQGVFAAAPVSLWIEDYSGIRALLESLRAEGVVDLAGHLAAHPEVVDTAMAQIRVLDVNDYTLQLFKAESRAQLLSRLDEVFRGDMRAHFAAELAQMWDGDLRFETEGVNYALDGTPIDILLSRCALPGHEESWKRVLVSIVDISGRKRADRALAASESYARGLFEHSPVSLWVEDYAGIKALFAELRAQGVEDLARHLRTHPEFVHKCIESIRVIDVNQRTLNLFRAGTKEDLYARLDQVFGDEMSAHFADELLDMWTGRMIYECEGINYTLTGEPIDIHLQRSVLPGHEQTWERVLISISDISARKKAEAYMKFLGTHDAPPPRTPRLFDEAAPPPGPPGSPQKPTPHPPPKTPKKGKEEIGQTAGEPAHPPRRESCKRAGRKRRWRRASGGTSRAVFARGGGAGGGAKNKKPTRKHKQQKQPLPRPPPTHPEGGRQHAGTKNTWGGRRRRGRKGRTGTRGGGGEKPAAISRGRQTASWSP